jgi:translation elongation factor EF-4
LTKTIRDQGSNKQVLDKLKVERERGITVKAQVSLGTSTARELKILLYLHCRDQTVSMFYTHEGQKYLLNLIDTPVKF